LIELDSSPGVIRQVAGSDHVWVEHARNHLSVELNAPLAHSLGISNVAQSHLFEGVVGASMLQFFFNLVSTSWNFASDGVLSVNDLLVDGVKGKALLVGGEVSEHRWSS
jgi:hypothetical protein